MSVYDKLGVSRIVSGAGPKTRLSGSIMPREAVDAMLDASRSLVNIEQLQGKASQVIARITGAEAGIVTTGAAAALTLAAASCVTGLDISRMERLPDTSGMNNEIVIPRHHRNAYDHAIRAVGAKLIEAGLDERSAGSGVRGIEPWEVEDAITERTVAIAYLAKPHSTPPLREVVRIADGHGLPVIVDAAAELPPASNLRRFISDGASAVAFSGGKAIRGPQASGILCGKREIVMGAVLQQLDMDCRFELWDPPPSLVDKSRLKGVPRHGIGRGFKAGKEEVVGLLTALELFAGGGRDAEMARYEETVGRLVAALQGVKGISVALLPSTEERPIPLAQIAFASGGGVEYMMRVERSLMARNPPVYLDDARADEMILRVNPFNLAEGDVELVAQGVREALEMA